MIQSITSTAGNISLRSKLVASFLATGVTVALAMGIMSWMHLQKAASQQVQQRELAAAAVSDRINRNLFERYGDVQAFGLNEAILDKGSWYQPDSAQNRVARAANQYAKLYGCYLLSLVVDLDGKVIAVNDVSPGGKPISSRELYQKNYRDSVWFKALKDSRFLKGEGLDGTYVEHAYVDQDASKIYGSPQRVIGFAAPIKDAQGKTVAYWNNLTTTDLIQGIINDTKKDFLAAGYAAAEILVADKEGVVVSVTSSSGGDAPKMPEAGANLHTLGWGGVAEVFQGRAGHKLFEDKQNSGRLDVTYAPSQAVLGFPGLGWGVLVVMTEKVATSASKAMQRDLLILFGVLIPFVVFFTLLFSRSISRPITSRLTTLNGIAGELSQASDGMSKASHMVADGASQQAASIEETSASLEEISSMTRRNSDGAQNARNLARDARETADAGEKEVAHLTGLARTLQSQSQAMHEAMEAIKGSSRDVSKIIKTIDEIAFQTNILALNAAVEAARAGEAGMGFAVVAEEVRNLAQRSATAARETASMIEEAVKRSEHGVTVNERVAQALTEMVGATARVETQLRHISGKSREVNEVVEQIAIASQEQTQGIAQVGQALTQMDSVVQGNAASAEENASASEQLNSQANALRSLVNELESFITGSREEGKCSNSKGPHPKSSPAGGMAGAGINKFRSQNSNQLPATRPGSSGESNREFSGSASRSGGDEFSEMNFDQQGQASGEAAAGFSGDRRTSETGLRDF